MYPPVRIESINLTPYSYYFHQFRKEKLTNAVYHRLLETATSQPCNATMLIEQRAPFQSEIQILGGRGTHSAARFGGAKMETKNKPVRSKKTVTVIGNTTYIVTTHFKENARETAEQKLLRLVSDRVAAEIASGKIGATF